MSPFPSEGATTCYYCGLTHDRVEAGGIWHCPNPLCHGPGAGSFRATLLSYHDVSEPHGRHTVDDAEWLEKGFAKVAELDDAAIRDAAEREAAKIRSRLAAAAPRENRA